jgi:putative nucleotidyltransferase with HDIG domain
MTNRLLDRIEKESADLPALPLVVEEVLRVSSDPEASAGDLERIVSSDVALSGRVLRAANSGLYNVPQRVSSLRNAVTILGFRIVRSLALSTAVFDIMGNDWGVLDPHLFRRHSLATAAAARVLAHRNRVGDPDDAFSAGLLHDIGKVLLARVLRREYAGVLDDVFSLARFHEVERARFGTDHAEVGAVVLKRWNLPARIAEGIRDHHLPELRGLAGILARADAAAVEAGYLSAAGQTPILAGEEEAMAACRIAIGDDEHRIL